MKGIPELKRALAGVVPALRRRALRNALAAAARLVRDEARRNTPVISAGALAVQKGHRKPGTVKRAISVRTSKVAKRNGDVGVFVNVRPAKNAVFKNGVQLSAKTKGAKSPDDPYYWRWLEFGRQARSASGARMRVKRDKVRGIKGVRSRKAISAVGAMKAYGFLRKGAAQLPAALQVFVSKIGPEIAKLNNPKGPQP